MVKHTNQSLFSFSGNFLKWLAVGFAGSFVLIYLISSPLFFKPRYHAEALVYVPLSIFIHQFDQQGIGFGSNAEIDAYIQFIYSTQVLDSLEVTFGLAERWDIDPDQGAAGRSQLHDRIRSLIRIGKTRYGSVSVGVRYTDPALAAGMANELVRLGDVAREQILSENRFAAYTFARGLYEDKLKEVAELEKEISLSAHAVAQEGMEQLRLLTLYESELQVLTMRKDRYETMKKSLETPLPAAYVVSSAVVPHQAQWPPRLLWSLGAAFAFVLLALFTEMIRRDA